jgi:hypothetical protein
MDLSDQQIQMKLLMEEGTVRGRYAITGSREGYDAALIELHFSSYRYSFAFSPFCFVKPKIKHI